MINVIHVIFCSLVVEYFNADYQGVTLFFNYIHFWDVIVTSAEGFVNFIHWHTHIDFSS